MIYLDSCALVKLVMTEPESGALQRYLAGRRSEMVSSQLALTEVLRVVRRSGFDSGRQMRVDEAVLDVRMEAAARLLDRLDLVVVHRDVLVAAGAFDRDPFVRTLDSIHLASAKVIGPELKAFVTYDRHVAAAAEDVGLHVEAPA